MDGSSDSLSVLSPPTTGSSSVLLTPGRTRNIAQDMEALRLSRQDNPYLQQVMASRESLIESHHDEYEADDTILMSQEFGSSALELVEDPITLKEIHDHLIRSPPPISAWPKDGLSQRAASAFDFGADSPVSYSAYSINADKELLPPRSPRRNLRCDEMSYSCINNNNNNNGAQTIGQSRHRAARSVSPRAHDLSLCGRPLSLPGESHLRTALGKKQSSQQFSILQPKPLRRSHSSRRDDDSEQLVQDCDK